jgi:hypothetical protein
MNELSYFEIVLLIIGFCLILLGGFAGYALLSRSLKISDQFGDETNVGTLWGLFMVGLSIGLFMVWVALP